MKTIRMSALLLVTSLVMLGCNDESLTSSLSEGPGLELAGVDCNERPNHPKCGGDGGGGGDEEDRWFRITLEAASPAAAQVLTTSTCGPGYLLALSPQALSYRVGEKSRMARPDVPYLVEFGGLNPDIKWSRVFVVSNRVDGAKDTQGSFSEGCYGETDQDELVGNLWLDVSEGKGKPSERTQRVNFRMAFDQYQEINPGTGELEELEDFNLSDGQGQLDVVDGPGFDATTGTGWAVVEGTMEFDYFKTGVGREPIANGVQLFRFRISIVEDV